MYKDVLLGPHALIINKLDKHYKCISLGPLDESLFFNRNITIKIMLIIAMSKLLISIIGNKRGRKRKKGKRKVYYQC